MAGIQCYPALEDAMIAALGATVERGRAMRGRAALQGYMVHAPCGWDAGPGRVRPVRPPGPAMQASGNSPYAYGDFGPLGSGCVCAAEAVWTLQAR